MCTTSFVKGITVGMITGAAISMVMMPKPKPKKCKHFAGTALKAAGEIVDRVADVFH